MTKQLIKPVLIGIIAGAAIYFMPFFFLRAIIFFLITGALIRLFAGRWHGRAYNSAGFYPAFTDAIRNMSEEEYNQFRQKFQQGHRCGRQRHGI